MHKGRKFKKAEADFARQTKSFDAFCAEKNIEIAPVKKRKIKRAMWISAVSSVAVAAVVVCSCIPLMRQTPIEEHFYSDGDVVLTQIEIESIADNNIRLIDFDNIDDYSLVQAVRPNDNNNVTLGYNIADVLWYKEYEGGDYLFEFDYIIRTDSRYKFKNLTLYNDCIETVTNNDISYKYRLLENELSAEAYITYTSNGVDYYIHMYDGESTTELSGENVETFIRLAL